MKKVKVMENLYLYTQAKGDSFASNTYLLKGKPNILIDAGFKLNEKVGIVVLTHCHFDHSRYAGYFKEKGAKIFSGAKDAKELEKASVVVAPPYAREYFGTDPNPVKVDEKLNKDCIIKNNNFKLKIIEIPGHSPGSIALYDKEKEILFSGDTWYGKAATGTWNHPGGNYIQLQKSIEKLKKIKPRIICSGHGAIKWRKKN